MTQRKDESDPPAPQADIGRELVVHKSARECPMIEPHRRDICGIVRTREQVGQAADARRRNASRP